MLSWMLASRWSTSAARRRRAADEQHRELVATEPCDQIGRAAGGAQSVGDLDEQSVAHVVTERVVDLLEAVEVDHQHDAPVVGVGEARGERDLEGQAGSTDR